MRSLVLLTLALFGLGTLATDASAFGKRKKRGASSGCAAPVDSCCGSSYGGYNTMPYGHSNYGHTGLYGAPAGYGSGYAPNQYPATVGGVTYPTPMPIR